MARANSNKENGLPVLGENQERFDFSNSSSQKYPPGVRPPSQSSRRTPTPTKQISLTAVKRREDSFHYEDNPSQVEELRLSMKLEAERSFVKDSEIHVERTEFVVERNMAGGQAGKLKKPSSRHNCVHNGEIETAVQRQKPTVNQKPKTKTEEPKPIKKEERKKEESSSDDSSDEEEEERKAPNQLLMEFLECIYAKDFQNAAKLCKMILIYEPSHSVALQFQPVIEEKIQLDLEAEQEGSGESGSDEDDSGEEEDDSDEDSDDSDENSSDEDDEDDDEDDDDDDENEEEQNSDLSLVGETEDSGIASTESSDKDNFYEM